MNTVPPQKKWVDSALSLPSHGLFQLFVRHVRVDHGRRQVGVPQRLLRQPDVLGLTKQIRRERVPEHVRRQKDDLAVFTRALSPVGRRMLTESHSLLKNASLSRTLTFRPQPTPLGPARPLVTITRPLLLLPSMRRSLSQVAAQMAAPGSRGPVRITAPTTQSSRSTR